MQDKLCHTENCKLGRNQAKKIKKIPTSEKPSKLAYQGILNIRHFESVQTPI